MSEPTTNLGLSIASSGLVHSDKRLRSGRTGTQWRPAWAWSRDTELFLRKLLEDAPRPVVHVGCGSSTIGDVRLDLYHPGADIKADSKHLPLEDGSAGTVLQDPPWTVAHLVERQAWITEAQRVLRVGGLYVVHAPWMPARPTLELEGCWIRDDSRFNAFPRGPIIISAWRKVSNGTRRSSA